MSEVSRHYYKVSLRIFFAASVIQMMNACTTMNAQLSLDPYVKDKQKRNALEQIAERYCQQKRMSPVTLQDKPQPDYIFTTDGCSQTPDGDWVACCIVHDIAYWCGGSEADRDAADEYLKRCVNQQGDILGNIFYAGVRLGGTPWLPTPWRWGYGWEDWPHGYDPLDQSPSVLKLIDTLNINQFVQTQLQKKTHDVLLINH